MSFWTAQIRKQVWQWSVAILILVIVMYGRLSKDWEWALLSLGVATGVVIWQYRALSSKPWFWSVMAANITAHLGVWAFVIQALQIHVGRFHLLGAYLPGIAEILSMKFVIETVHRVLKRRDAVASASA